VGVIKLNRRLILLMDIARLISGDDAEGIARVRDRVELRKTN
jgi:hypothetical protein